ncbi:DHS-like NAD/FAD-binding domain-containing protein [Chytriomyces sp. MP71]|nr:DHS-like NAD/FAD-binding domain-containing protein [Chytriomyces sp. MP71]
MKVSESFGKYWPRILTDHSIEAFANYIKENGCKNILVLTGAGLSTSAGIPDFRTPGTGLYDNLEKYKLPTPQSIFDIDFFRRNPEPFYLLARELYPGNFKPTLGHLFIRLLAERGMLLRNFTQNIDTLERVAGIPDQFLVEAHGSFATASCVGRETTPLVRGCGAKYTQEWVRNKIMAHETPTCLNPLCDPHSLVKPDITFFGEPLPRRFFDCVRTDFAHADAVIVMGSSLKVSPFAMLPLMFGARVPRLLINREVVGNFDATNGKDTLFLGGCDEGCLRLANLLGFKDELLEAYRAFS